MFFAWGADVNPFDRLRAEMNRLFDSRFLGLGVPAWIDRRTRFPRMNMTETAEALTVACELPGVEKDAIDISVEGGVLTIKGERKEAESRESERYHRRERGFGPFERAIELPVRVDVDKVEAKLSAGVLEITLPKHPESKPKRIDVKLT